jgi:phage-related minor tail protein
VNHNRRVTVAWRRHEGPAFLNRAMNNARDPEEKIPQAIAGITRETLLVKMADALTQHGSPELRKAIEENCREVLAQAEQYDSLHDLVDSLLEKQSL